jgi:hypothetical protein
MYAYVKFKPKIVILLYTQKKMNHFVIQYFIAEFCYHVFPLVFPSCPVLSFQRLYICRREENEIIRQS